MSMPIMFCMTESIDPEFAWRRRKVAAGRGRTAPTNPYSRWVHARDPSKKPGLGLDGAACRPCQAFPTYTRHEFSMQ